MDHDEVLDGFRSSIDNIDVALIHLLAERFRVTRQVGDHKVAVGLPSADPDREAQQVKRMGELAVAAGVVDDRVDAAMALRGGAHQTLEVLRAGDRAVDAEATQFLGQGDASAARRHEHQGIAETGQLTGAGGADTAPGGGHNGDWRGH